MDTYLLDFDGCFHHVSCREMMSLDLPIALGILSSISIMIQLAYYNGNMCVIVRDQRPRLGG